MDQLMGLPKQRALGLLGVILVAVVLVFVVFRPGEQASAGVDLDDPTAWIEHGIDGELLQMNAVTGEVTARVEVAESGDDFWAVPHGGGAVLINRSTSTLSLISGSLLEVTSTVALGGEFSDSEPLQLFGNRDPEANIVVLEEDRLVQVDPRSAATTETALGDPLRSVAQDRDGVMFTLDGQASTIKRLNPNGLDDFAQLDEPVDGRGDEQELVRSGGGIYAVDPARLFVAELLQDGSFGRPTCMTSGAAGARVGGTADSDDPLIIAFNQDSGVLSVSRPGDGCSDIDVGISDGEYGLPVTAGGVVYLPNYSTGRIVVVDIAREQVVARLPFGSRDTPFELELFGSTIWANERQGPFAAIVSASGITPFAKISSIVAGEVALDGEGDGETLTGGDVEGSGLRILGDSGATVISSDRESTLGGPGDGPGTIDGDSDDLFDSGTVAGTLEPDAIGIVVEGQSDDPPESPIDGGPLIANFGVSSGSAVVGEVLRFTDFSSGSPTSWTWDFGDGTGAQEPNVEKSWSEPGNYLVALTVTNALGDQAQQSTEITVVPETVLLPPAADFSFDRNTIEEGESVAFQSLTIGEADILEWSFGDGDTAMGAEVSHTYDVAGEYTVTLTASNPAGASDASTLITVLSGVEPPVAVIRALPQTIVEGQFVTLSSASLNEPTRLNWDFGDGTRARGTSVRHAWNSPGTYRVRLTAENSEGSDSTFVDVVVSKRIDPPVSQFTQSATEVEIGESVTFTNLSLNEPTRLSWNFGDDTTAWGQTATKSWSQPGRYRVTLRATNDAGTNRTGVTITVVRPIDPPIASFAASQLVVAPNTTVTFSDTSSNDPRSWSWDFGDGATTSTANTQHSWSQTGTYTVRLTVQNESGSSSAQKQVVVKDAPSANFRWKVTDNSVKFTDTSWDDPETWSWDFGDGTTSTDRSPTHTFAPGEYNVTLVVSNGAGTSSPKTQAVLVAEPPVAVAACVVEGRSLRCSADGSKNAVAYTWRSPDARSNSTPNQASTVFTFTESGRYDITLVVKDKYDVTDSVTIKSPRVQRVVRPRILDVRVVAVDGDLVRLEAEFDRDPESWDWTVDGAVLVEGGNSPKPLFRVPSNGQYSGVVTATNDVGSDRDEFSFNIDSFETTASFTWAVIEPGVVRFDNTSSALAGAEFRWRFDGAAEVLDDNKQRPVVRYPDKGGSFRVVLRVVDDNGTDTVRVNIDVPRVDDQDD